MSAIEVDLESGKAEQLEMPKPQRLGKYRFIAEIGHGGMAEVYLAVVEGPARFSKLIALKMLREQFTEQTEGREMFLNEARLAARLSHPNVVNVLEVGEDDGRLFIAMEYLRGQPLSRVMARIRKAERELISRPVLLRVLSEALSGLHHAHECTDFDGTPLMLVHRDVSPHNIFVTYDGSVKVLDFGIAKAVSISTHTRAGTIKGKVAFLSPEQLLANSTIDRRVDIYALGCCLWEVVAGKRPFQGLADVAVMTRVATQGAPPIREAVPDVPPELERICMKAVAYHPEDRYQDANEFQTDLDKYIASLGVQTGRKEIGTHMSEMFADERERTRQLIEANLSTACLTSTDEYAVVSLATTSTGSGSWSKSGTPNSSGSAVDHNVARSLPDDDGMRRSNSRMKIVAVVAVAAAVGLGAVIALRPKAGDDANASTGPITSSAPSTPGAQVVGSVKIKLAATPATARIFLDDRSLAMNPMELTVPADGEKHKVRAEASGYEQKEQELAFDKDQDVKLDLEAVVEAGITTAAREPVRGQPGPGWRRKASDPPDPQPTASVTTATPAPTPIPTPTKTKRTLDDENPFD